MRAFRKKRGRMSQEDLATASGVKVGTLRKIEQGRTPQPQYDNVAAFDDVLDANGAIIRAFGYTVAKPSRAGVTQPDGSVSLAQHLALMKTVDDLAARVEDLDAELKRWKRGGGRGAL